MNFCKASTLLLFVLLCGGCNFSLVPLVETSHLLDEPVAPGTPIHLGTVNGSITVKEAPADIEWNVVRIEATTKCVTQERCNQTQIIRNRENGTFAIKVRWPDNKRKNREGCDFVITIPHAQSNGVHLRSSNGQITIEGLSGPADLHTSNGPIKVQRHTGSIKAHTSNGQMEFTNVSGDVDAQTSNGKIEVTQSETAEGTVNLKSSNGAIDFGYGANFSSKLKLHTSNGSLNFENLPEHAQILNEEKYNAELQFGDSEKVSEIYTSNGSITIHVAP